MKKSIVFNLFVLLAITASTQDTATYRLRLDLTLLDYPEVSDLPYHTPTMQQSLDLGNDLYDLSYWGIDALGNFIFERRNTTVTPGDKILNGIFQYAVGAAFSKYGSELPIPLGVYTHEEFHRSVLGVNGIGAENGNWLLSRWDGTVYGVSDEELANLKETNLPGLLYSYTAGLQSEALFTQQNVVQDVFYNRSFYKNSFYLYNAYYIWNYFDFATSPLSDSVKVIAPEYEDVDDVGRDFAGADLTAWAYDMFLTDSSYYTRDAFPEGEGVNRRIGFSDLPVDAQDYLVKQKSLSLLNFINPAIFCINRINIGDDISFNLFAQYMPTHFGNDISFHLPLKIHSNQFMFAVHNYNNFEHAFYGFDAGLLNKQFLDNQLSAGILLHGWMQPKGQDFFATTGEAGGAAEIQIGFPFATYFQTTLSAEYKTNGWLAGNPYLDSQFNFGVGIQFNLPE